MPGAPRVGYGDSLSLDQLAQQWRKSPDFVRGLVRQRLLAQDERGLVTNAELQRFYRESGTLLDG